MTFCRANDFIVAYLYIFSLLSMYPATSYAAKVTVIVESGFEGETAIDRGFARSRISEQALAKQIGAHEIRLFWGGRPEDEPTATNMIKRLGDLRDVTDIQLAFIGHGGVVMQKGGNLDPERFPPFMVASQEKFAPGAFLDTKQPLQFMILDDEGERKSFIGIGDIEKVLDNLKANNPGLTTTIKLTNCYSGNVSRAFSNSSRTQVFAVAPRNRTSRVLEDYTHPYEMLNKYLAKGESYNSSFLKAQREYIQAMFLRDSEDPLEEGFPRNQFEEMMQDFCARADAKSEADSGCADCKSVNAALDIKKKLAVEDARQAPIEARALLDEIARGAACRATREDFNTALKSVRQRVERLITQPHDDWTARVNALTEADQSRLMKLEDVRARIFPNASLGRFKRQLLDFDWESASVVDEALREKSELTRDEGKEVDYAAAGQRCGFDTVNSPGKIPGEAFIMTPAKAAEITDRVVSCIEQSPANAYIKGGLAERVSLHFGNYDNSRKCAGIENLRQTYASDLTCADHFVAQAEEKDWKRLIEIDELGGRHVVEK